jgi:hypothetical protein
MKAVSVFHCCDKIPEKSNLREKDLFWLTASEVSEVSVEKGMSEESCSPHGSQEADRERERGRKRQRQTQGRPYMAVVSGNVLTETPRVGFTNPLGISQSSQVGNQD